MGTLAMSADENIQREVARIYQRQNRAVMRLHLFVIGEIHDNLSAAAKKMRAHALGAANESGLFDARAFNGAQEAIAREWEIAQDRNTTLLYAALEQTALVAFGGLAHMHALYFGAAQKAMAESVALQLLGAAQSPSHAVAFVESEADDFVFKPQLAELLRAAEARIVGGLRLSDRIWRNGQDARHGIEQVLFNGVANGKSAWDVAKDLEQFLGAGASCPRWTSTRLGLTKAQIAAGDPRGRKSGEDCAGQGVAYNALRLARTEIQAMHALATQALMAKQPWTTEEQMMLSPAHPKVDVCDDIIHAGRGGVGIYPKGTLKLPIHPNCLCHLVAVPAYTPDEFTARLREWMGGGAWPEMDEYARNFGDDMGMPNRAPPGAPAAGAWSVLGGIIALVANALTIWLDRTLDTLRHAMRAAGYVSAADADAGGAP